MVYNGYYKVMSNIPKMGQLPTPDVCWLNLVGRTLASVDLKRPRVFDRALAANWVEHPVLQKHSPHWDVLYVSNDMENHMTQLVGNFT